jgi:hypothetical protein
MKKHFKWVIVATVAIILLMAAPTIPHLIVLFAIPWNCDDLMPIPVTNGRGDVAEEQVRACTGIGTILNYSITLQPRNVNTQITIVKYSPLSDQNDDTALRWIDDDTLVIDLGEVRSVWSQVDKIGSIHITYSYTKTETGWW